MSIENQLDRLIGLAEQQNGLLQGLLGKYDHIDAAVTIEAVNPVLQPAEGAGLEEAAASTNKRKPRRTKAQMEEARAAEAAAKEPEVVEEPEGEAPPDPKEVKTAQEFKKELVAIGRASEQTGYVAVVRGVLAEAGYEKAENVPEEKYDDVIAAMEAAFEPEEGDI
jgi:hypothetical protein